MEANSALVEEIREASRSMVREWGFLGSTLAATDYSPSAVHALLELERSGTTTAANLVNTLKLEKSSVSRLVGKLVKAGEVKEFAHAEDGRSKQLTLTARGKRTVAKINTFSRNQVRQALAPLSASRRQAVARGLMDYASALAGRLDTPAKPDASDIEIAVGYRPGLIGRIVEMHADFYARHWNFGAFFERRVATNLAEFIGRVDRPANRIWLALQGDRIVGSVAIDGEDLGAGQAHLRWFILDDGCRGGGIGRRLMAEAVAFCDRSGFQATQLFTFKGLEAARRLYEDFGFTLTSEEVGDQWGSVVTEQQFTR